MNLPAPYYQDALATLYCGDCRDIAPRLADIGAVVTDPPYGLGFMGKGWDHQVPGIEFWQLIGAACLPGAHLVASGGTRTFHRLACAIEDAGWELRDTLGWVYGSGFPKSLDVGKAIDKAAGATREKVRVPACEARKPKAAGGGRDGTSGASRPWIERAMRCGYHEVDGAAPATAAAREWDGWGTALKPAWEPIILARWPLDGTVAGNVLAHGVGGINVDGCRVGTTKRVPGGVSRTDGRVYSGGWGQETGAESGHNPQVGRWPANVCHDGSAEVLAVFPQSKSTGGRAGHTAAYGGGYKREHYGDASPGLGDDGSAARFFYCAKASAAEREAGCAGLAAGRGGPETFDPENLDGTGAARMPVRANHHPTVKPLALMRWLLTLVAPPGALVIDPFAGSGSTLVAAKSMGIPCIGIELDPAYCQIVAARVAATRYDEVLL